ncbi:hypothetical protein JQ633_13335 [Bradyrhizobium tropiciagri]|uniref:hypothetical protein n=1 Tax=Bradyrhizobium tropiciagri TaxID=312253 RepID=UPI001BA6DC5B|nr:hypothetical protein [Bradyrhizobium tropiciagri]MBR0871345.1 hypothetical protein [Bradyrhizobium tropiciagri]
MSIALQVLMVVVLCLCAPFARAAETSDNDEAAVNNPVELQSLQQLNATKDKPLFTPTRRPPPKPVAPVARQEPPPPPAPPPSVVVLGIVSENGSGRAAIRAAGTSDKVLRVRAGDDVGGWKVERVESRRLVLTQGERSVDFAMFGGGAKPTKPTKSAERRMPRLKVVAPD